MFFRESYYEDTQELILAAKSVLDELKTYLAEVKSEEAHDLVKKAGRMEAAIKQLQP